MTGSKVGQFFKAFQKQSSSGVGSTAGASNSCSTAPSLQDGSATAAAARAEDVSQNHIDEPPPSSSEQTLFFDIAASKHIDNSSTAREPLLPFHQQQEATVGVAEPLAPLRSTVKSVKIAAAAAAAVTSEAASAAEAEPTTPFQAAADAGANRKDSLHTNSVSIISPQLRSMSTSNALLNAGSVSAGRNSGLNRKSIGAMSLSPNLGMDGFKIRIGICAMDKKANSKPMKEIVSRLEAFGEFEVVFFGDELILDRPIAEWPKVDCLMSWYSDGFPLTKAQAYADSTHPFLINDLHMQDTLQDRRAVYQVLKDNGIAVPAHIVVDRDGLDPGQEPVGFIEEEDYVELDGVRIDKPFVEKPASGEDHNIHIYYPHSMGGGVKRLFRKIDNKSSCYDPNHPGTVRRDGSYIYEEFLATGGTDVKVYTVGPRYAHAEARKSPVVDGRVLRTADGKEMRFPVLLSPAEKEISRTVCLAFGQKVCGFDLLRSEKGRSYVCDVNGWSFVKNSRKYYDDAAGILRSTILAALAPHRLTLAPAAANPLSLSSRGLAPLSQQSPASTAAVAAAAAAVAASGAYDEESLGLLGKTASLQELSNLMGELSGVDLLDATRTDERSNREELRCVLAVIRHGDRTPKQKLKVRVRQPALLQLFNHHADSKGKQAKLKSPAQLQELLDICRQLLQDLQHPPPSGLTEEELEAREEQREKLNIVKTVLEQGGQFSGINRKVQLKPLVWSTPAATNVPLQTPPPPAAAAAAAAGGESEGGAVSGKQQHSGAAAEDAKQQQQQDKPVVQEVLLILKYGGVLTHSGRAQAEELGKVFRLVMYPRFGSGGGGLLRLHSTYRHDLKIYSSDEGRVQVSAAAFTKGLLALEGSSLTPILVSLVAKDASMLDAFGKGASDDIRRAKQILYTTMTWDPATATANNFTPTWSSSSRTTTPAPTPGLMTSPPLSPRAMSRAGSGSGAGGQATAGFGAPPVSSSSSKRELEAAVAAVQTDGADSAAAAVAADSGSISSTHPTTTSPSTAAAAAANGPSAAAAGGGNALVMDNIPGMPDNPLLHLKKLNELMKTMVEQLRQLVLAEKRQGVVTTASSSAKDLVQTEADAAAAAAAPAEHDHSSTAGPVANSSSNNSSTGQQQQQQLLTTMTSLTSSTSLTDDLPVLTNQSSGCSKLPSGLPNSPPRPSTAPPGGAAAAASGGSSSTGHSVRSSRYSSLSHDPHDWRLQGGQPCSGEKLLLMFDRWQKLAKSFYKKGRYDISKVPDIYDSAKYDALHNKHLGLGHTLEELYKEAKILADAVIPNEYGVDPAGKLAIGSKIATELLAKLLDDLRASKEESLATLTDAERSGLGGAKPGNSSSSTGGGSSSSTGDNAREPAEAMARLDKPLGRRSMPAVRTSGSSGSSNRTAAGSSGSSRNVSTLGRSTSAVAAAAAKAAGQGKDSSNVTNADDNTEITDAGSDHGVGGEAEVEGFEGDEYFFDEEPEMMHRLCPMYASDINSPLRHVRTRIYFTSESHMHSLVNILRLCHLRHQLFGSSSSSSGSFTQGGSNLASSSSGVNLNDPFITPRASMDIPTTASADVAAAAGRRSSCSGSAAAAATPLSPGRSQPPGAANNGSSSSSNGPPPGPLISEAGLELLRDTSELDYLTQLVFRLYENKAVPADHPQRFRIEILFSPGTAYNPITEPPAKGDHTLPPRPRVDLHIGEGATLADFDKLLRPFSAKRRQQQQQQQGKDKDKDGK